MGTEKIPKIVDRFIYRVPDLHTYINLVLYFNRK